MSDHDHELNKTHEMDIDGDGDTEPISENDPAELAQAYVDEAARHFARYRPEVDRLRRGILHCARNDGVVRMQGGSAPVVVEHLCGRPGAIRASSMKH